MPELREPDNWLLADHKEPYAFKPSETLRLRCRIFVDAGDVNIGKVAEEFSAYSRELNVILSAPKQVERT